MNLKRKVKPEADCSAAHLREKIAMKRAKNHCSDTSTATMDRENNDESGLLDFFTIVLHWTLY